MDTEDWCGLVVRTRARLAFGVMVGTFTEGPYAGRLCAHGAYRFGGGTRAQYRSTLVYAIPPEALRRTRRRLTIPQKSCPSRVAYCLLKMGPECASGSLAPAG